MSKLVSWCFDSSQPLGILHQCWKQTSIHLLVILHTSHLSSTTFFFSTAQNTLGAIKLKKKENWFLESDHRTFHQTTQYHMVVRWKARVKRRSLEVSVEPSLNRDPCVTYSSKHPGPLCHTQLHTSWTAVSHTALNILDRCVTRSSKHPGPLCHTQL